jgi:hypothetical protein
VASRVLDIEWLLSTLFDASLLTFEPPATAALFSCSISDRGSGFAVNHTFIREHSCLSRAKALEAHRCDAQNARIPFTTARLSAHNDRGRPATMSKTSTRGRWTERRRQGNAVPACR